MLYHGFHFDSEGLGTVGSRRPLSLRGCDSVSSSSLSNKNCRADRIPRDCLTGAAAPSPPVAVAAMRSVFTGFDNEEVVLAVHGEVDLKTVPQPGVLFDEVTASEHPSVRLNLTGMDSIDAAGLTATVSAERSLISDAHADQFPTGQTPCVDTSVAGHWFPPRTPRHPGLLERDSQWPVFVRAPGDRKSP